VELKRRGFQDEAVFESTGLTWSMLLEDDRFLSLEQFRRVVHRGIDLTREGWLGLDVGRSTQVSSHGPLGYAMVASPDVATALDLVARYSELRLRIAKFAVDRGSGRVRLRIEPTLQWNDLLEYISLHIIGALALLLETISGSSLPDTRISFVHAAPPWVGEYARRLGNVTLVFNATEIAIDLPKSFAALPCITRDTSAFEQAVRLCERAKARREDDDVAQRVLGTLLDRQGEYPSLSEMAKGLHMSNRTLIRRLKAQGTSYQILLDDVRQDLALWYLRETELPVEAVAERLGYRDTSNFSRTCKRWFGVTARAIRAGSSKQDPPSSRLG